MCFDTQRPKTKTVFFSFSGGLLSYECVGVSECSVVCVWCVLCCGVCVYVRTYVTCIARRRLQHSYIPCSLILSTVTNESQTHKRFELTLFISYKTQRANFRGNLIKKITPKIRMLCFVLINSVILNLCLGLVLWNASSHSFFSFLFYKRLLFVAFCLLVHIM